MEKKCPECTMMIPEESKICPCCGKKFDNQNNHGRIIMDTDKKCLHCAMMIPKDAKICPYCRKIQSTAALVFLTVSTVLFGIWIFSLLFLPNKPKEVTDRKQEQSVATVVPSIKNEPTAPKEPTIEEFKWETSEYGIKYIIGTIKNDTGKECKYAQVSFALFDGEGAQVGTAWANINNLEAGGIWKFKAMVSEKRAVEAKFKGITSF